MAKNFQPRYRGRVIKEILHKINSNITSREVRIVDSESYIQNGVYSTETVQKIASDNNQDLVQITDKSDPPVCKIIEYNKFLYDEKKKEKEKNKKQKENQQELKELRYSPRIGENDYTFKTKQAKDFLKNNDKVKVSIFFKGRSIVNDKSTALEVLKRLLQDCEDCGVVETEPKLEGKKMYMIIRPIK
jgi:translation initiation factor IF-3